MHLHRIRLAALLVPLLALQGPAQDAAAPEQNPLDPLEGAAREAESAVRALVLEPLTALALDGLAERLPPGFTARFPQPADGVLVPAASAGVTIAAIDGERLPALSAEAFVDALRATVAGFEAVERAGLDFVGLLPSEDLGSVSVRARFELGGRDAAGARTELHATLELELASPVEPRPWTLTALRWLDGHRASSAAPRFVDVSDPTGFHLNLSPASQRLLRELIDDRTLWAIGGVSALDWNADGRPDLVVTRRDQLACLFVNDGRDGFRREALPIASPRALGACFLFLDLDGDGLEELVPGEVAGQSGASAWLDVFTRRDGEWVHLPRTLEFRLEQRAREPLVQAIVPADVDGDGQIDLFVGIERDSRSTGGFATPLGAFDGGADLLFMNRGGLTFVEESRERGLGARQYTTAACFLDGDRDGDRDLFVGTSFGPDQYHENDGGGKFTPRLDAPFAARTSIAGGLALDELDGAPALFVTNPFSPEGLRVVTAMGLPGEEELARHVLALPAGNRLFQQDRASGAWLEQAGERGLADAGFGFGPLFFDLDQDGDRDLFVANGVSTHRDASLPDFQRMLWRQVAADALAVSLKRPRALADAEQIVSFRGSFAGSQRERAFVRAGGERERFYEAGYALGLDLLQDGRSAVAVDFDGDGDLDLATFDLGGVRLLENRGAAGRFARVVLEGLAAECIGAQIELTAGGKVQRRVLGVTSGHASQTLAEEHFGLGGAEGVERVRVTWASGASDVWESLPADRRLALRRGRAEARVEELPRWPAPVRPRPRAVMTTRLVRLDGKEEALATTGRPALIACWSPADAGAPELLAALAALDAQHAGRVRVVGVCVGFEDVEAAQALAREHGGGLTQFRATPGWLGDAFGADVAPELPTIFVFDASGGLRRVVVRTLDVPGIEAALASLLDDDVFVLDLVRKAEWQILQGDGPGALESLRAALRGDPGCAAGHEALGKLYVLIGDLPKAAAAFGRAAELDPDSGEAHYNLGTARINLGEVDLAVAAFEAAWRVRGDHLDTLVALGSAYVAAGRIEHALEAFERARGVGPQDPQVWYLCARALIDLGRTEEARGALSKALELAPGMEEAQTALDGLGG